MNLKEFLQWASNKGLTPYQIAKDLGLKSGTVYRWLNGGKCYMDTKRLIEDVYGIELSLDVLVKRKPNGSN